MAHSLTPQRPLSPLSFPLFSFFLLLSLSPSHCFPYLHLHRALNRYGTAQPASHISNRRFPSRSGPGEAWSLGSSEAGLREGGTSSQGDVLVSGGRALYGGGPAPPVSTKGNVCEKLRLYNESGRMPTGAKDWSSTAETSAFVAGPCLKIPGIHTAQRMDKSLVITDRAQTVNSAFKYAGTRRIVIGIELTWGTWRQRNLDTLTETFCSSGAFMPDGSLVTLGGSLPRKIGVMSVRGMPPCPEENVECKCQMLGNLTSYRWYPTAQILPEGRVFIVGGSAAAAAINSAKINNPSFEYWPPRNPGDSRVNFPFLGRQTLPYNLYPFVQLLSSGRLFIFAGTSYVLFDTSTNGVVPGSYPTLSVRGSNGRIVYRNYPNPGSSALLPLTPKSNYTSTVMICGGCPTFPKPQKVPQLCEDRCWMIQPEVPSPSWSFTYMCRDYPGCTVRVPRVHCETVLLADGTLLLIGGGSKKKFNQPISASQPALTPILYDPYAGEWYTKKLATSFVPRFYHANALLLHDGTVLVSGSNPNTKYIITTKTAFPSESRTEFFIPPYFFTGQEPPALTYAPTHVAVGTSFTVCFRSNQSSPEEESLGDRFRLALSHPGLSSHGQRHSMRHIELEFTASSLGEGRFFATVSAPPSLNIAPPTFYWLFVLDHGVPNQDGQAVIVVASLPPKRRRRKALSSQCPN